MRRTVFALLAACLVAGTPGSGQAIGGHCAGYSRLKNAYFGDLHTHTSFSLDAYTFGTRSTPADAYAFARGLGSIDVATGFSLADFEVPGPFGVTLAPGGGPLDFDAITDHSESLATDYGCIHDPTSPFYNDPWCVAMRNGNDSPPGPQRCDGFTNNGAAAGCAQEMARAWQEEQAAVTTANDPCTFTSFKAYEWTKALEPVYTHRITLHQNVIFRTDVVPPVPLDALDFPDAPGMWAELSAQCHAGIGCEALTIPHNMNESNALAFDTTGYTAVDLNRLLKYRKLVELHQHKGNSECLTDPHDSGVEVDCAFEVVPEFSNPRDIPGYARPAMKAGLERFPAQGFDDVKIGFVAGTDSHNATPGRTDESTFTGHIGARDNLPMGRVKEDVAENWDNPGGLTGVWAEENTRDAIFAALKRRETFATSGTRLRVRFFQNVGAPSPCTDPNFPERLVDAGGVPMGGTLREAGSVPQFVVFAVPDQTSIEVIEIVKASIVGGTAVETVQSVAVGPAPHCVTWEDTAFDPAEPAFWYARVKEAQVWRWSHGDCEAIRALHPVDWATRAPGCDVDGGLDVKIRERAWTSAIWHLPGGPVPIQATAFKMRDGTASGGSSRRKLTFVASTRHDAAENRIVVPGRNTVNDPTIAGATLTIYNPESGETFTETLAASGWQGNASGSRYGYSAGVAGGSVGRVVLRNDSLAIRASGPALGFTLDEARQGTIAVRLQLGTAQPWCAEAHAALRPGTAGAPPTTAAADRVDRFVGAKRTPPPDQCPVVAGP